MCLRPLPSRLSWVPLSEVPYVMAVGVVQARPGSTFPVAVPERLTVCVLPGMPFELSVIVRVALFDPVGRIGANVMLIVQDAPTGSCPWAAVQESLLLSGNSVKSVLLIVKLNASAPRLVKVAVCGPLLLVTSCDPKIKLAGDTVAPVGATRNE